MGNDSNEQLSNVISLHGRDADPDAPLTHEESERRRAYILEYHPAFKRVASGLLVESVTVEEVVKRSEPVAPSNVIPFRLRRPQA